MDQPVRICRVDEIPVLGSRRVARANGPEVAIFRNADDEVFALLDRCPHKGGPLSQGIVFGRSVACPLHNWTISFNTGAARAPDEGCTPTFSCRVDGASLRAMASRGSRRGGRRCATTSLRCSAQGCAARFAVKVEGGWVMLDAEELATKGIEATAASA